MSRPTSSCHDVPHNAQRCVSAARLVKIARAQSGFCGVNASALTVDARGGHGVRCSHQRQAQPPAPRDSKLVPAHACHTSRPRGRLHPVSPVRAHFECRAAAADSRRACRSGSSARPRLPAEPRRRAFRIGFECRADIPRWERQCHRRVRVNDDGVWAVRLGSAHYCQKPRAKQSETPRDVLTLPNCGTTVTCKHRQVHRRVTQRRAPVPPCAALPVRLVLAHARLGVEPGWVDATQQRGRARCRAA